MNDEVKKILNIGKNNEKLALFSFSREDNTNLIRKKFNLWARWFFPKFFSSPDALFHQSFDFGNINTYLGNEKSFLNIGFRGCAKTSRTKIFIAFCIANDRDNFRRYFKILSKDGNNSKQIVTDIYNLLISLRVRELYPYLFEKTVEKREETMVRFTTATGIKVASDSIGTDQRGDIQDESRPDFLWFEDIETRLSLMSAQITHKIWESIEEARTGLSKDGVWICTANYISERGNVHKLVKRVSNQLITPIERNNEPTWGERYSIAELDKIKQEADDYAGEYLCKPSASKDVYFDRESVDKQVIRQPIDIIAGLKIFKKYDSSHRIGSGHDVAGGVGLDSSTSVFIDFSAYPIKVIATYKNNEIKPDVFAYEIVKQAKRFGENYLGVEKNYGSTLDILKTIYPTDKIHKTERNNQRVIYQAPIEYGFETNTATKNQILINLSQAIENGIIELNDEDLINEARSYTIGDLMDKEVDPRLATRHFDLLIACAIAFEMNRYVKKPEVQDTTGVEEFLTWEKRLNSQKQIKNPAV